jgi:glyoxylase-like metal-dependent hydrolase (beta-lactamase superfamily II)
MASLGYEFKVLKPGILVRDRFGNILDARSTVTLIIGPKLLIIVDTGLRDEEDLILSALSKLNIQPQDLDILVNTHSHPDHSGNNRLFEGITFIGHRSEFSDLDKKFNYQLIETEQILGPGVCVVKTPGHTHGSVSVFFSGKYEDNIVKCAITGDALPILDNYLKWIPPGINFDPDIALESMKKITNNAEIIIPGHDKPFRIIDCRSRQAEYLD